MLHDEYLSVDVHVEGRGAEAGELDQRDSPLGFDAAFGRLPGRCEDDSRAKLRRNFGDRFRGRRVGEYFASNRNQERMFSAVARTDISAAGAWELQRLSLLFCVTEGARGRLAGF